MNRILYRTLLLSIALGVALPASSVSIPFKPKPKPKTPPKVDLGIMALPRVTINQRDGSARMAIKKTFFNEYTVAKGTLITLSSSPVVQGVKRPLSAIARLPVRKGRKHLPA